MGFVFQQPTLLKNLNILDNIILPSMRDGKKNGSYFAEKAKMLMEKTGIAGLENRDITQASGGQLQRVGICRALMGDPKIIFGDEPTGALNSTSASEIMRLLAEIHRAGTTILLVTHDVKVAARTERVLFMLDGRIAGEYSMGRHADAVDGLKAREERLTSWLAEMKF
jgi:putative ABC transport system ATP-binding protein